jgi:hypothetical protein
MVQVELKRPLGDFHHGLKLRHVIRLLHAVIYGNTVDADQAIAEPSPSQVNLSVVHHIDDLKGPFFEFNTETG